MPKDIYAFIKQEEAAWLLPITVVDGWEWNMRDHIRKTTLYKNSQFFENNMTADRDLRPFKNIIRPILDLQYRTEGFDVKDVVLYINDPDEYYKSFLANKWHEDWAYTNEIDTVIDEMVESYADHGGALVKDVNGKKPEVVQLASLAFCDKTDMLSGPIGIKHFWSPDELQAMSALGWGNSANNATVSIQEAIVLAQEYQVPDSQTGVQNKTPGKYIEGYEVHGALPESWIGKGGDPDQYVLQMQIILFYKDQQGNKHGLTLFSGREKKSIFKAILRNKIHGRALGFGGVEELFDAQMWTNLSMLQMQEMLEAASKVIIKTTDEGLAARHPDGLKNLDNLDIIHVADGKDAAQMSMSPINLPAFERAVDNWGAQAQLIGAASDAILGENPPSGTPFQLQQLITQNSGGLHEYRRGKLATFWTSVYRDWIIPEMSKEIVQGSKWMVDLSLDELQQCADALVTCQTNDLIKDKILKGQQIIPADIDRVKANIRTQFMQGGSKRFLEILQGEMKDLPIQLKVDVAGKQKDLDKMVDKLTNIFRQIIANPGIFQQIPGLAKTFNEIIEYSGLSPIDFSSIINSKPPAPAPVAPAMPPVGGDSNAPAAPVIPNPMLQTA